jgi:putative transposase
MLEWHTFYSCSNATHGRSRRLSKDYELLPEVSEAVIYAAMVKLTLNRLAS